MADRSKRDECEVCGELPLERYCCRKAAFMAGRANSENVAKVKAMIERMHTQNVSIAAGAQAALELLGLL